MRLDFLSPSDLPYPGAPTSAGGKPSGCGTAPYATPDRTGVFNQLFAPKDLAYPLPACPAAPSGAVLTVPLPTVPAAPAAPAVLVTAPPSAAVAAPIAQAAPVAAPVAVPVAQPAPATSAPVASVPVASAPVAASQPTPVATQSATVPLAVPPPAAPMAVPITIGPPPSTACPTPAPACPTPTAPASACPSVPSEKIVQALSFNPRLRARPIRAHEEYLEELLDEAVTVRMLSRDATPLAFVVPDGCNAVDLFYGPIEVNPELDCAEDLDLVITLGDARPNASRLLQPGDQITVIVPWRAASWVELAAGHLCVAVYARFYSTVNA